MRGTARFGQPVVFSLVGTTVAQARPGGAAAPPRAPPADQLRSPSPGRSSPRLPVMIDPDVSRVLCICSGRRGETWVPHLDDLLAARACVRRRSVLLRAGLLSSACNPALTSPTGPACCASIATFTSAQGAPRAPVESKSAQAQPCRPSKAWPGRALLGMWQDSHAEIDEAFGSVPQPRRSATSCGATTYAAAGRRTCPHGAPPHAGQLQRAPEQTPRRRSGSDHVGPSRASRASPPRPRRRRGGARRHGGLDITASTGEPRARDRRRHRDYAGANSAIGVRGELDSRPTDRALHQPEARRGRHLRLYSARREKKVVSCYMHLSTYRIAEGGPGHGGRDHRLRGPHRRPVFAAAPAPRDPRRRSLHQSGALLADLVDPAQGDDDLSLRHEARASARLIWTGGLASPAGRGARGRAGESVLHSRNHGGRIHLSSGLVGGRAGPTVRRESVQPRSHRRLRRARPVAPRPRPSRCRRRRHSR